jgi:hypothetical protein
LKYFVGAEEDLAFQYGDLFIPEFISSDGVEALPLPLQVYLADKSIYQGTAGAVINLKFQSEELAHLSSYKLTISNNYILTAAHVGYFLFLVEHSDKIEIKIQMDKFNENNKFAQYSKVPVSMDYALLPCSETFFVQDFPLADKFVNKKFNIFDFCHINNVRKIWKNLSFLALQKNKYRVIKRGMKTGITEGWLMNFDADTGLYKVAESNGKMFADHGDSCAIVFLLQPNDVVTPDSGKLFPVGMIVSGNYKGNTSSFISLNDLFRNFCKKQQINELDITFKNPKIEGTLNFSIQQQAQQQQKKQKNQVSFPKLGKKNVS